MANHNAILVGLTGISRFR